MNRLELLKRRFSHRRENSDDPEGRPMTEAEIRSIKKRCGIGETERRLSAEGELRVQE